MTTPYCSRCVNDAIVSPLNTLQYPNVLPYHNYVILNGQRPTPQQFYPSQEPVNANMFVNARKQYIRANATKKKEQNELGNLSSPITKVSYSSQRHFPVSSNINYTSPISGSMYTNIRKSKAVGKSSYKVGLPLEAYIGSKSYDNSFRKSALQRARSGGCTAPKKKGSIYNTHLTQQGINGWGRL